jgi:hypothetical protein
VFTQVVQCPEMALGEIDDVDVVADGSAVFRIVVYAPVSFEALHGRVWSSAYHHQTQAASRAFQQRPEPTGAAS